jgi:superfamily II DNA helicase RecQ
MDIPDIDSVIQFMVALSLSILIQYFGRAGRSGQPVVAILLTEPSVFQVKKKNNVTKTIAESENNIKEPIHNNNIELSLDTLGLDDADIVTEYRKKTEVRMHDWCLALGCRWYVSDKYFNNPARPNGASFGRV